MPITALRSITSRTARTTSIVLIGLLFILLLVYEALHANQMAAPRAAGTLWVWYATYAFIGAFFFGVGSLVWLYSYARQRVVASLLFCFCTQLMLAFGSLSGAAQGDGNSTALGASTSALAVFCLFLLLLRFPRKLLPESKGVRTVVMQVIQVATGVLSLISASSSILSNVFQWTPPSWWYALGGFYYVIVGLMIVLIIVLAMRTSPSVRTLQQSRLFFAGTLLSFVPILSLTVLPQLLNLTAGIDGTRSMISLVFFPIAMAYSLLRYELLVFDIYVRRVVTWVIGSVCIALLGYILFAISSQLISGNAPLLLASLVGAGVLLAPATWWQARRLTERFFFPETAYYATRLREAHARQGLETFDLKLAAHQLVLDVITTLRSPEACIFMLDEESHIFRILPLPQRSDRAEQANANLLTALDQLIVPALEKNAPGIREQNPCVALLGAAQRPLFLSEITDGAKRGVGLARYLKSRSASDAPDPLLAPLKTPQGKLIGMVAIGERGDRQLYAGPELEVLQQLVDHAASAIETARLYELVTQQQFASTKKLEQAYEQQRMLNEQKDQFIIHVSHELRTPLSEVTGYLDMLVESSEELDSELRTLFLKKAQHGSEELQTVVETILNAVETSFASPLKLNIETVTLAPIVQGVLDHLDPQAMHGRTIEIQIPESIAVRADAHALQLILENLLSNALKYTPAGTPVSVSTAIEEEDDAKEPLLSVQVRDAGPGIPLSEAPLLFEKFARLQRDLSGSIRGSGLGLYINKQLVEAMGGRIWVESSGIEGEGSLFCFTVRSAIALQQEAEPPVVAALL